MDEPLWIKQGEAETYRMTCREANGRPADLSNASAIEFRVKAADGTWVIEKGCNYEDSGVVTFALTGAETQALSLGRYEAHVRATVPGGYRYFPKPGFETVAVVRAG